MGSWRSYRVKTHSILTFQTNGGWVIENRTEDSMSRIVSKKGKVTGEWFYTDDAEGLLTKGQTDSGEGEKTENDKEETKKKDTPEDKGNDKNAPKNEKKYYLVLSVKEVSDIDGWIVGTSTPFEIVSVDKEKLILKF